MSGPRILVIGSSGQVGSQIVQETRAVDANAHITGSFRSSSPVHGPNPLLDARIEVHLEHVTTPADVSRILSPAPDTVFCLGGLTNVDLCESDAELAMNTNARGPALLAAGAAAAGSAFVYYSTEYIFAGGSNAPGPYQETASPDPLNVYGRSKLAGEHQVLHQHPGALIIRTTGVYGADAREKNFLYTVLRRLQQRSSMTIPNDQVSTPTYNRDLAAATLALVRGGASGIFNVCGSEQMARLELAQRFAAALELDSSLLSGASTAELRQIAPRPLQAGLSNDKIRQHLPHLLFRSVEDAIKDCASDLYAVQHPRRKGQHAS